MKFAFAKTVFYFSLVSLAVFALVNVIQLLQSKNGGGQDQLELTLKTPQTQTVIVPTPVSNLDISNWNSEISAYLNVSFKYPPSWSQVLTQRNIIAHTTKEENPRGIWITKFDNSNHPPLKTESQVVGGQEITRTYVQKDMFVYEIKGIIFAGNEEEKEVLRLVIKSIEFL